MREVKIDARDVTIESQGTTIEAHATTIAARPADPAVRGTTIDAIEPGSGSRGVTIEALAIAGDARALTRASGGSAIAARASAIASQATEIAAQVEQSAAVVSAIDARGTPTDARGTASASRGVIDLCQTVPPAVFFETGASGFEECAAQEAPSDALVEARASLVTTRALPGASREGGRGTSSVSRFAESIARRLVRGRNGRLEPQSSRRASIGVTRASIVTRSASIVEARASIVRPRDATRARFSSSRCATDGSGVSIDRAKSFVRIKTCRSCGARWHRPAARSGGLVRRGSEQTRRRVVGPEPRGGRDA